MSGLWRSGWLPVRLWVAIAATALACAGAGLAAPAAVAAGTGASRLELGFPLVARYHALQRWTEAVTTPGSLLYGDYEPIAQLARRFGSSAARERRVVRYLRRHGAGDVRVDATGLYVYAAMPRATATRLFAARPRAQTARARSRDAGARVPAALRGAVAGVVGLRRGRLATPATATPPSSAYRPASGTPAGCKAAHRAGGFTPRQYMTAYRYSAVRRQNLRGNGENVALIEIDGFRMHDIRTFASCFGLHVPRIVVHDVSVRHHLAPGPVPEATLDLEVLDAVAPRLRRIDVYESRLSALSVIQALTAPLQHPKLEPQVISASLGLCELVMRQVVGYPGMRATIGALEIAAANGISIVASTGDSGSSGCTAQAAGKREIVPALAVSYPASSPWVTAVGGTNLTLNRANAITDQVVWNDGSVLPGWAGGGGFSTLFTRPSYQRGVVGRNRRAIPDVAMLADPAPGYDIYCSAASCGHTPWEPIGGTSAATPLVAGGLALIDERLRERHREQVGFANPLLYQLGRNARLRRKVFDDVTVGTNDVMPFLEPPTKSLGCCSARPGFDEASGWGSLNLAALEAQALRREPRIRRSKP